jgi:hypothetical protein
MSWTVRREGLKILGLIGLFLTAFEDGLYTDFSFFPYVTLPSLFVGILAPAFSMGLGNLPNQPADAKQVLELSCACFSSSLELVKADYHSNQNRATTQPMEIKHDTTL